MRKITDESINAFLSNQNFNKSNTRVIVSKNKTELLLFGNLIAVQRPTGLYISNAGWRTNTTKERLNGLPNVRIQQITGKWWLNGVEWDGKLIKIK